MTAWGAWFPVCCGNGGLRGFKACAGKPGGLQGLEKAWGEILSPLILPIFYYWERHLFPSRKVEINQEWREHQHSESFNRNKWKRILLPVIPSVAFFCIST
jgi:hypothetical protein